MEQPSATDVMEQVRMILNKTSIFIATAAAAAAAAVTAASSFPPAVPPTCR